MSYTEGLYAIGDAVTASFEVLRMFGSGLPFGGVMNWVLIITGIAITAWWMKIMTSQEEEYDLNKPD